LLLQLVDREIAPLAVEQMVDHQFSVLSQLEEERHL
jgi:hypothetical protein